MVENGIAVGIQCAEQRKLRRIQTGKRDLPRQPARSSRTDFAQNRPINPYPDHVSMLPVAATAHASEAQIEHRGERCLMRH